MALKTITGTQSGFTVPAADIYQIRGTVITSADVVVHGTLRMRAGSKLIFTAGQLHVPDGILDIQGTAKTCWVKAGGTRPTTWAVNDEVVYLPVQPGDYLPHSTATGGEILNLTRSILIQGPSRIQIESPKRQTIRYCTVLNAGKSDLLGHYPIHFHHSEDGSRGSLLEGVVVRGGKHHAYAVHGSYGVTLRNCIAYDTIGDAYWYDLPATNTDSGNNTNDLFYDRCVAAFVYPGALTIPKEISGFLLGAGTGNACVGCVAVGVGKVPNASGFHWPSQANSQPNVWRFEDNVAHNNQVQGIFVWQNTSSSPHNVDRFESYSNGDRGISHGAYNARGYHYRDSEIMDEPAFVQHAHLAFNPNLTLGEIPSCERTLFGGTVQLVKHTLAGILTIGGEPTDSFRYIDCIFANGVQVDDAGGNPSAYGFIRCNLEPEDFDVISMHPLSRIRVQRSDGTAYQITAAGTTTIGAFT